MADQGSDPGALTVGLDLGDKYTRFCVLDESGRVVEEGRIGTTRRAFEQRFGPAARCRIALEVGTHSPWVARLLEGLGHEVVVANPRKVRLIYESDNKRDELDAQWLARLARLDPKLLSPVHHRGEQLQRDLAILRSRDALVVARARLVNHVRGSVKSFGGRIKKCSTRSFHKVLAEEVPEELRPALNSTARMIAMLTRQIDRYDRQVEEVANKRYPATQVLQQVTGVGPLTALTYVLTVGDPLRFRRSRALGAYFGLRPRRNQSGNQDPELRVTKAGDANLRRLLVGAAHYILGPFGPDSDLRRWGLALASRGDKNAKKRAVVAVARKLAVLLHRLWLTGDTYEPLRNAGPRRRTARQAAVASASA